MKTVLLIITLALASCLNMPSTKPSTVVSQFYTRQIHDPSAGAPTAAQLETMAPALSRELQTLLAQARQLHDQQAAAPDAKPAFADGDIFSSLFEGPSSFEIVGETKSGNSYWVQVRFLYDRYNEKTQWIDNVLVTRENGRYVIADIEYQGSWGFANQDSLLSLLKGALAGGESVH